MTIDVITKAGMQISISILPEELTACPMMEWMIKTLVGAPVEVVPKAAAPVPAKKIAPAKESTPKNQRALEIDKGKICALWKAGTWSVIDIVRDVGCSEQTVRNTLKANGLWALDEAEADLE